MIGTLIKKLLILPPVERRHMLPPTSHIRYFLISQNFTVEHDDGYILYRSMIGALLCSTIFFGLYLLAVTFQFSLNVGFVQLNFPATREATSNIYYIFSGAQKSLVPLLLLFVVPTTILRYAYSADLRGKRADWYLSQEQKSSAFFIPQVLLSMVIVLFVALFVAEYACHRLALSLGLGDSFLFLLFFSVPLTAYVNMALTHIMVMGPILIWQKIKLIMNEGGRDE